MPVQPVRIAFLGMVLAVLTGAILANLTGRGAEKPQAESPVSRSALIAAGPQELVGPELMQEVPTTTTTEPPTTTTTRAPVVSTSPPQTVQPRSTGCGYEQLIREVFPPSQGDKAIAVAMRESGCTNTARNPSGASGLFQLMMPLHANLVANVCGGDPNVMVFDAGCNVRAAYALWQGSGWGPWGG